VRGTNEEVSTQKQKAEYMRAWKAERRGDPGLMEEYRAKLARKGLLRAKGGKRHKIDVGQKFGRLTVMARGPTNSSGNIRWYCRCACGNQGLVIGAHLNSGRIKSCGCWRRDYVVLIGNKMRGIKAGFRAALLLIAEYDSPEGLIARNALGMPLEPPRKSKINTVNQTGNGK
jgi:hypothetical protein